MKKSRYIPWNIWFWDTIDSLSHRLKRIPYCWFNRHIVKFGSYPYCYICGRKPND